MIDRARILQAPLRILWAFHEGSPDRVVGHAYLCSSALVHLVHSPGSTPEMIALLDEWQERYPESAERREWTTWYPPGREWSLTLDAGAAEHALGELGDAIRHEQVHGPDRTSLLARFPIDFLRRPVQALVEELDDAIDWPASLNASVLRPSFRHARDGETVVVTGCRYGSRHADAGQDRTAAVFLSRDAGRTWDELPWDLPLLRRFTPSGRWCWPPEQIDRVVIAPSEGLPSPRIEWEDPWIAFDPGNEWEATWKPRSGHWAMRVRRDSR